MRRDHVVLSVITPVGAGLLYFLVAGEVSGGEAIAGAIVVGLACLYAVAVARTGTRELRLSARGVGALLQGYGSVPGDLWRVGWGLVRARTGDTQGAISRVPFRTGGQEAGDVGRRAAVVTALSLAPNAFALGIDDETETLVLHQLVPADTRGNRDWPQ